MEVLTAAAQLALRAPSAFNTQPWRWLVRTSSLELHADRDRHLGAVDPEDRLITMSCGAALHHARIALAAAGHDVHICRWPEPGQPDLLARIWLAGPHRPSAGEVDLAHAITTRRTDRRAFADTPVPADLVARLRAAAETEGVHLHVVRERELPVLARAATRAASVQLADPEYRSTLIRWTNRPRWSGDGVPPANAVRPAPRRVPVRELSIDPHAGVAAGSGQDRATVYTILFGDCDDRGSWLRAGEALSAVLLTAAAHGLAAAPMTDVVEVPASREALRQMLSGSGHPYAGVRVGVPPLRAADQPATPRRPASAAIDHEKG
ncbi:MAG: nitroreductase family protein [Micromonosporaceae bacterium]|jgi:hypothetical protein|nr:nitroreductase family protein [Micromonosporaceae bacterium]